MFSKRIYFVDPESIKVERDDRQRRDATPSEAFINSIRSRGIMNPLIITKDGTLKAGERRLNAAKALSLAEVPCRHVEDMDEVELQIIELEENVQREDLPWQDKVQAYARIHRLYKELDPKWTKEQSATTLSITVVWLNVCLDLTESIEEGDKSIIEAETSSKAKTILTRRRARQGDEILNSMFDIEDGEEGSEEEAEDDEEASEAGEDGEGSSSANALAPGKPGSGIGEGAAETRNADQNQRHKKPAFRIEHADFTDWIKTYKGKKFNLLHADFPYGVELNEQANQGAFEGGGYKSNPDIYWTLCEALAAGWSNIMYPSSHFLFWISMEFYTDTIEFFEERIEGLVIERTPLVWHKTDNKGIIKDAMRGPRNVMEFCLFGRTGDRKIVKPVSNCYGAPTDKARAIHTNEKPVPMLKHFLQMVTDEHTRMLDPTAGSGSAIRCAELLGAESALGLEFNPDFAKRAEDRLRLDRNLARVSAAAATSSDA